VPTPNHDHVVDDNFVTTGQIWWEVRPVLVMNQSDCQLPMAPAASPRRRRWMQPKPPVVP
jgi:hypothetical protein